MGGGGGEEPHSSKEEQIAKMREEELKPSSLEQQQSTIEEHTSVGIAGDREEGDPIDNPSWFTPRRLLFVFCAINLLNYIDRGVIGSTGINGSPRECIYGVCLEGTGIQGDFRLNNFEDGILSSAFMVGLLVASPIFASLAKSINPFRLIGVGLTVWTLAAVGCGVSWNFWTIAIARMYVGVGEASFISLAAPFIDDNAPAAKVGATKSKHPQTSVQQRVGATEPNSQKTAWLATFYMCIPTGVALGYVIGGWVGSSYNWRYAFFGEAILMVPFAIFGFVMKPLKLKGFSPVKTRKPLPSGEKLSPAVEDTQVSDRKAGIFAENEGISDQTPKQVPSLKDKGRASKHFSRLWKDLKALFDKVFVFNVLGYIAYNFVIGAYSYWGPKAGKAIYHMKNPDLFFGAITIVCGIFGTLAGGLILDRMNSTIRNAFKLLSTTTFLGAILCFAAFCLSNLYGFVALFAIGQLLVFATQAPVNYVCLHCVKPSLRPLSMALSTVLIHILGDVPSSPLVGLLQDHIENWRTTTLILTSVLFLAAALWFIGVFLHSVDKSDEEEEHQVPTGARSLLDTLDPLLAGSKREMHIFNVP